MKISIVIPNYNNSKLIVKCIDALINQEIDGSHIIQIIVVDDGSTDDSANIINETYGCKINLIRLPSNQGRSTARNVGAKSTDADYLIFIDSDCIASDYRFIKSHIDAINAGFTLLFGQVDVSGDNFWDRLQKLSFEDRFKNFNDGKKWVYTTQNVCVKRSLFIDVGGFNLELDKHGFEDRDLFIRLIDTGAECCFVQNAKTWHQDNITLKSVSTKLLNSGRYSSRIFNALHPIVYKKMPYSKIDCQIRPWLVIIDFFTWPFIELIISSNNSWLDYKFIPFRIRAFMARSIYSLCYLHGTKLSRNDTF